MIALQMKSQKVAQFLHDANSFVASSLVSITRSAPHIYISAVPFVSKDSLIYQDFAPLCTGVISVEISGTDHHASRLVMTLTGHDGRVASIAYSPFRDLLAAGLDNGTVHIWDTRTGEEMVSPIRSGDTAVHSVAFAPDGQCLTSGTENGAVSVWDVATGRLHLQRPQPHSKSIDFLVFSPDGKLVASSSCETVGLWNMEMDQIVSAVSYRYDTISLSFSPDGTVLTLRSWGDEQRWHAGAPGPEFQLLLYSVNDNSGLSSSLEGPKLSLDRDDDSGLISVTRAGRYVMLPTPSDMIRQIRISPEETCFVASGTDYDGLQLWDLRCMDADPKFTVLDGQRGTVLAISFSSDGKYLASELLDHTIRIWDVGPSKDTLKRVYESGVNALAVSPDNNFIVSGRDDGSVQVHDVKTGEVKLRLFIDQENTVGSIAISPDGRMIATTSEDCIVRLWHAQTGAQIGKSLSTHENPLLVVAFSPNSRWIASGSDDGTVLVWDVATRNIMDFAPMRCQRSVTSVTFSSNGEGLAAGDLMGNMYFWHLVTGQLVHRFQLDGLRSRVFSPSASRLLASDEETPGIILIVDVNTEERLHSAHIPAAASEVYLANALVAWSHCEQYVAMLSKEKAVCLWDLAHNTISMLQGFHSGFDDHWSHLAFASDGQFLWSGEHDGVIQLWNVADACSLALRAEDDPVVRLANAELEGGWLVGPSGELLLWVPADYQKHLQFASYPRTVFGPRRIVVTVGEHGLNWGGEWHACWRGAEF